MIAAVRGAASVLCVAGVPVLVLTLVYVFFGVPITAYRPVFNDEVVYWHQALTFSYAGFGGGYYTLGEVTNPSGLTPFGPHGPGYAVLYGMVGAVFGWHRHTAVLLNLIAIGASAWIWVSLARVSVPRLILAGALLLTFWHLVFWAPTGMQESVHHAGALVLAGCVASALGSEPRRGGVALGWVVLGVLAFIRPSWIILLPVWAMATTRGSSRRVVVATTAVSVITGAAILFAYSSTTAPYDGGFFFLRAASLSLGAKAVLENITSNVQRLAMLDQFHPIELLERKQYWALLLSTAIASVAMMWKRRGLTPHLPLTATVLTTALIAMLVLYQFTNYAEHRVLSAFLLFGAMVCLTAPGRIGPALTAGIILSNVVSARPSLADIEDAWRNRFVWDRRGVTELERAMDGVVVYRQGAPRWCNTLLTSQYPPHLVAVPAGVGISVVRKPEQMILPPRSRYLLLDEPVRAAFVRPLNLQPIATLPYGTLYLNVESGCQ